MIQRVNDYSNYISNDYSIAYFYNKNKSFWPIINHNILYRNYYNVI